MKKYKTFLFSIIFAFCILIGGCSGTDVSNPPLSVTGEISTTASTFEKKPAAFSSSDVPAYSGQAYVIINNNEPDFEKSEYTTTAFEEYSSLDSLGRCGVAYANICREIMPTEKRETIGQIKPSGWQTVKYDIVDGKYLYNRCHLIGFQLAGENANEKNLITGTRYMNMEGMLPFENMVADYVKETNHHVLYRVTPVFENENLVAAGVEIEAYSVEDNGEGICFHVFVYNVQPGITINYKNGDSHISEDTAAQYTETNSSAEYIINTNTKKFHFPTCPSVSKMNDSNKIEVSGDRQDLIDEGYEPCGNCRP